MTTVRRSKGSDLPVYHVTGIFHSFNLRPACLLQNTKQWPREKAHTQKWPPLVRVTASVSSSTTKALLRLVHAPEAAVTLLAATGSRSHPRCHRCSSRCRCDSHRRNGRHRGSPPRHIRADSKSYKQSSSQDRSPGRSHRSQSRTSRHSVSQTMDDKRELSTEKTNTMQILGVEKANLPESVKPDLSEQLVESEESSSESETWVRQHPEKIVSQSSDEEPDDISNPKMSPLRKSISFSINNSVAKPTAAALSCAKVTPRVDSYESRKPYGHWIPVRAGKFTKMS
ncbi:unnamed protein product [Pleuronectes platessa]|uniref:Arginine/serine-rich protein 1 n=1 Tax=Pleuronectes platessa TaxID=8262 RepID=A0A9N7VQJ7_PLEPL|nr:unnamed protein product [Pleuronectes platessa]